MASLGMFHESAGHIFAFGGQRHTGYNLKMCLEAKDALYECVESQPNENKYRCPDQLFAYEQWCPGDVQRAYSEIRAKEKRDNHVFDEEMLARLNKAK